MRFARVLAAIFALVLSCAAAAPNVLLIVSDDQGYPDLGCIGTRDIKTPNWRSKRIVLAKEGVGFSVHETTLYAGTVNDFWYANHIEAVFIVEGEGELVDKETSTTYELRPLAH